MCYTFQVTQVFKTFDMKPKEERLRIGPTEVFTRRSPRIRTPGRIRINSDRRDPMRPARPQAGPVGEDAPLVKRSRHPAYRSRAR